MFELHAQLQSDSLLVVDLPLCQVRLMNNVLHPWLLLIPRRVNLREITDLNTSDRMLWLGEVCMASQVLQAYTKADKMNIAALGNITPQLHTHVIARFIGDSAWPNAVWGRRHEPYSESDAKQHVNALADLLRIRSTIT